MGKILKAQMSTLRLLGLKAGACSGLIDMVKKEAFLNSPFLRRLTILSFLGLIFLFPHCVQKEMESGLAPDFTLKTLDDQEITLSKLRGKVVLLDFWATWCGPCKESIPHLVQIYTTFQQKGLEVIGMNVDRGNVSGVYGFVKSMDIPYPVVITPDEVGRNYGVTGLPTMILLDKQGRIRDKIPGFSIKITQKMAAKVVELISENP